MLGALIRAPFTILADVATLGDATNLNGSFTTRMLRRERDKRRLWRRLKAMVRDGYINRHEAYDIYYETLEEWG